MATKEVDPRSDLVHGVTFPLFIMQIFFLLLGTWFLSNYSRFIMSHVREKIWIQLFFAALAILTTYNLLSSTISNGYTFVEDFGSTAHVFDIPFYNKSSVVIASITSALVEAGYLLVIYFQWPTDWPKIALFTSLPLIGSMITAAFGKSFFESDG